MSLYMIRFGILIKDSLKPYEKLRKYSFSSLNNIIFTVISTKINVCSVNENHLASRAPPSQVYNARVDIRHISDMRRN